MKPETYISHKTTNFRLNCIQIFNYIISVQEWNQPFLAVYIKIEN